jgi:hypothetical protein
MTLHICKYCNYSTQKKALYDEHLTRPKHKNNFFKYKNDNIDIKINNNNNINNKIDISGNIIEKIDNLTKQNEEVIKQNEELRKEIQKLKDTSNQNTQTIVKEARVIKKSILSMLNSDYKDTPSIDYIKEDEFREEFEEEYNLKLDDTNNKLFMRIFSDYKKRKLIGSLCNVIVRIIKKEDQKKQSVFNIDAARGNYATKIQDIWHNDKKGLQLKKYTIDVVTKYMLNIMDIYRERLVDMYNENKKKKNISVTDYIMEYQGLLFEVNAFLTNPNTHKRIILQLCPELRFDDNLLLEMS